MYRKATLDDCKEVYNLICNMECKKLPFERFSSIYQEQLSNRHYYCLVYEYDARVIGVLNLRFEEQLHHSECIAEVMEFAIDPAYRGQGIGKGMLANACQQAKRYGCIQIEAACNQLRADTHRFYLREVRQGVVSMAGREKTSVFISLLLQIVIFLTVCLNSQGELPRMAMQPSRGTDAA